MENELKERKELGKLEFYFEEELPELPSIVEVLNDFARHSAINMGGEFYLQVQPNFYARYKRNGEVLYEIHIMAKIKRCYFLESSGVRYAITGQCGTNIVYYAAGHKQYNAPVKFSCEGTPENSVHSFSVNIWEPEKNTEELMRVIEENVQRSKPLI